MAKKTIRVEPPDPIYTLFNATRKGLPEVVFVNEALLSFPHIEVFPWYLSVEVHYSDFAENEMPSPAEGDLLNEICDEIEDSVLKGRTKSDALNSLFLARSTWNGIRELAFQVHDPEIAHSALQDLLDTKEWKLFWRYEMRNDPEWEDAGYFFKLFPTASGNDA